MLRKTLAIFALTLGLSMCAMQVSVAKLILKSSHSYVVQDTQKKQQRYVVRCYTDDVTNIKIAKVTINRDAPYWQQGWELPNYKKVVNSENKKKPAAKTKNPKNKTKKNKSEN